MCHCSRGGYDSVDLSGIGRNQYSGNSNINIDNMVMTRSELDEWLDK